MMKLTDNFTLEELCITNTGLPNIPRGELETRRLLMVASFLLQPLRNRFGKINVSSGYRTDEVNAAIGGAPKSQHKEAEAADIFPDAAPIVSVFEWARINLVYGQIILEKKSGKRWIHISLPRLSGPNQQALVFDGVAYHPWSPAIVDEWERAS
jgi:zinc D-Ala-D-Ala carboxypeptidase